VASDEGTDRDALTALFGLPSSAVPSHEPATVLRDLFQLNNDSETSSRGDWFPSGWDVGGPLPIQVKLMAACVLH
jgi:hypothetical protein